MRGSSPNESGRTGTLIGLDQDPTMLELARPRLAGLPVELVHANFDQLPEVLANRGLTAVDGVFADLGFASDQMDEAGPRAELSRRTGRSTCGSTRPPARPPRTS